MDSLRKYGLSHIYLDENIDNFSNVAIGLVIRALGANFNVCYYNSNQRLESFFKEVICSSKLFLDLKIDFYHNFTDFKNFILNKKSYDLIVIDNFNFNDISEKEFLDLLKLKDKNCEIVFVSSLKNENYELFKNKFDLISEFEYKKDNLKFSTRNINGENIAENKLIFNLTGNGKGKSTSSFGYLFRSLIDKKNVGLVYFDKGGNFYSERVFFEALSKFSNSFENNLKIGKFDFYVSGMQRFDGKNFRFENNKEDLIEAKVGIEFAINLISKKEIVVLEELNSTISLKLLIFSDIEKLLSLQNCDLVITGRYSPIDLVDISNKVIVINDHKHYSKKGHGVKKGIDF